MNVANLAENIEIIVTAILFSMYDVIVIMYHYYYYY